MNENPYFHLKQFIGDYWNCNLTEETMNSPEFFRKVTLVAVKRSKTKIVKSIEHKFTPQGFTLLMVLSDSSLILHSWPEERFISAEIFTCSKRSDPEAGLRYYADVFKPEKFSLKKIER
ncbi:MAG: adenosylmethionine decarboxylase [Promethearchaeota archaeon]